MLMLYHHFLTCIAVQVFWQTPPMKCLGTATRQKKVLAMNLQVQSIDSRDPSGSLTAR